MAKKQNDSCCAQCERAKLLKGTEYCLCALHGPVRADYGCKKFVMAMVLWKIWLN